jgi:hypothetical protein
VPIQFAHIASVLISRSCSSANTGFVKRNIFPT